jgi:Tol biopolymer transport system component
MLLLGLSRSERGNFATAARYVVKMRRLRLPVVLVVIASAWTPTCSASASGLIALSRARPDGSSGSAVWTMRPDGSQLSRLTPDEPDLQASDPTFSPGGDRLAYWQDHARLIVVRPDGSDPRTLTTFAASTQSSGVAWDPLAARVVFTHHDTDCGDCPSGLYATNLDGSGQHRLRVPGGHAAHPTFAPDGRALAYDTTLGSCSGVYTLDRAGRKRRTLIPPVRKRGRCLVAASQPSFAPRGRQLTFVRSRNGSDQSAIWTLNLRTRVTRRVTPWGYIGYDTSPAWSPDARVISYDAFVDVRAAESQRYVFRVGLGSGAKPRRLVTGWSPSWQGGR